jgi:hypothetical protein
LDLDDPDCASAVSAIVGCLEVKGYECRRLHPLSLHHGRVRSLTPKFIPLPAL